MGGVKPPREVRSAGFSEIEPTPPTLLDLPTLHGRANVFRSMHACAFKGIGDMLEWEHMREHTRESARARREGARFAECNARGAHTLEHRPPLRGEAAGRTALEPVEPSAPVLADASK